VRPSSPKESHRPSNYNRGGGASPVRRCYTCHSPDHLARSCPDDGYTWMDVDTGVVPGVTQVMHT